MELINKLTKKSNKVKWTTNFEMETKGITEMELKNRGFTGDWKMTAWSGSQWLSHRPQVRKKPKNLGNQRI